MIRIFLSIVFSISLAFGVSDKLASIPPAQSVFIDLSVEECDEACLNELVANEQYFSFLSQYDAAKSDDIIKELYTDLNLAFRIDAQGDAEAVKIALLVPQKRIRRYAMTTVNTVNAYLLYRQHNYELEVFNSIDESPESLQKAIDAIRAKDFKYVIAPVTQTGANYLINKTDGLTLYIPTVHRSLANSTPSHIIFGGIDYYQQIKALSEFSNSNVATFSDGSLLGKSLDQMVNGIAPAVKYSKEIKNSKVRFKSMLKDNTRLMESSIYLNMPLVKSSLLASQLRVYGIEPHALLSTQINYHPMLLTLTQYDDRKELFIGNAIDFVPNELRIMNSLLGHSIEYDWVNYATSIGIDHFYTHYFNPGSSPLFKEMILEGQVQYKTLIMKANRYRFYSLIP